MLVLIGEHATLCIGWRIDVKVLQDSTSLRFYKVPMATPERPTLIISVTPELYSALGEQARLAGLPLVTYARSLLTRATSIMVRKEVPAEQTLKAMEPKL